MPDVGVLELTIKDNASDAAGGLDSLSRKLANVKNNADGFSLSGVSTQINNLVRNIKATDSTIQRLGTLFNSIANFKKVQGIKFDAQPFRDLKEAIGDGLHIGNAGTQINAIRNAMTGDWGGENANKAIDTMGHLASAGETFVANGTAKAIRDVAKSVQEYVNAIGQVSGGGAHDYLTQQVFPQSAGEAGGIGTNMAAGIREGIESQRDAVITSSVQMVMDAVQAMKQALGIHSPSQVVEEQVGTPMGQGVTEGLIKTESEIQTAAVQVAENAVNSMRDVVDHASIDYSKLSLNDYIPPSLADRARFTSGAIDQYKMSIDAAVPSLRAYKDAALAVESKQDLAGFSKKTSDDFITHAQDAERAISHVSDTIQEKVQATTEVVNSAVKEGWGTGSIKPIYENIQFGPTLAGFYGVKAQLDMMKQISKGTGLSLDEIMKQLTELSNGSIQFGTSMQHTASSIETVKNEAGGAASAMQGLKSASSNAIDIEQFIESYSHIDYLKNHIEELKRVLAARLRLGLIDKDEVDQSVMEIKRLTEEYERLVAAQNNASSSASHFSFKELKKGLKEAFPLLARLKHQLGNIFIRRGLMAALRTIIAGFKEGTQNVYEYSKAIGSTFHQSMDSAASSIMTMKNSLGAALAPAIQAIIPILQTVINWFITLVNYANQFFALLGGQATWTRALPATTTAFKNQEKAAKGAGSAMKDLLADWDELNIIQSQSGGGGGGGSTKAAEDYLNMFEEVNKFDQKIKDIVQWVKDNFDEILTVAEGIGAAILMWKLSRAFGHELSLLQKLELAAGLTLLIDSIKVSAAAGYDIGKNGINGENAIDAVGGVLEGMLGGGLAGLAFGGVTGGLIGLVAGGFLSLIILDANIERGRYDSLYGDLHKDADDIKHELEENILTIEAKSKINIVNAEIASMTQAEGKVTDALYQLEKAYPVDVRITTDNAKDFKAKVDELVKTTNDLIHEKENTLTTIYVPATAEFTPEFIKNAWGDVSSTVDYLGEQIGKELSKSIIDNTRLDDLRKKLLELTSTVLTAQRQSEFGGAVGALGGATRSKTRVGDYDRETVQNYMKGYNDLIENTRSDAEAHAKLEYTEVSGLVASLEDSIRIKEDEIKNQNLTQKEIDELTRDVERMKKELETAQTELKAWNEGKRVTERTQELLDEWTYPGRSLYEQDIMEALSVGMGKNKNHRGLRNYTLNSAVYGEGVGTDEWVEQYLAGRKADLISTIAAESGMDQEELKQFINSSGINPLSFFDEDFIREYQDKIIHWLGKSKLTDSQKEKVLESLGLTVDEATMREQEKIRNAIYEAARAEENGTVRNASGKIAELKREYGVDAVNDVLQEMEDIFITGDGHVIDDSTLQGLYKHINWSIGSAGFEGGNRYGFQQIVDELYNSGDLEGLRSVLDYIQQFGVSEGFQAWKEYGPGLGSNRKFVTSQDLETANAYSMYEPQPSYASAGSGNLDFEVETEGADPEQDISNISAGVNKGTTDIVTTLNSILTVARIISQKEFKVNVNANADWGFHNNRSNDAAMKVSG